MVILSWWSDFFGQFHQLAHTQQNFVEGFATPIFEKHFKA